MAGTDSTQATLAQTSKTGGPAIILVKPQLGENIGMVTRAMLNNGLTELRLVKPRDGWPNPAAEASAAGAIEVLEKAQVFETTEEAIADLHKVYATTARTRDMTKPVAVPHYAAKEMRAFDQFGQKVGVLFGPEKAGLHNDDVVLADTVISVPLNPKFSSLNLAQAVLLIAYEWFQQGVDVPDEELLLGSSPLATKDELLNFYKRLEAALDESGFLWPPEKRPNMVRNLRNIFQRAHLTDQEVNTLHGVVKTLQLGPRVQKSPKKQ
ncbi:rRNA methyltransferase [Kiloniella spongiae]|uniref:tRNA (cytidine/uridine-2'-O-)-methyltransferase TrmJ n=1 Tax=Kiloniella spongiae TaxID=1489064 RepID=A0A0H2M9R1_9PROT|nr:RNA methyltransferase [Kiloniella spongiae]KLN59274.1 rRNA methyltransferase [Kiloniella spongiae]